MGQYVRLPIDLETRVETLRLARALRIAPAEVAILFFRFTCWADANADGEKRVIGVDGGAVDAVVKHAGFFAAAAAAGMVQEVGSDETPEVIIFTDLVSSETWAVRLAQMDAEAERKRRTRAASG